MIQQGDRESGVAASGPSFAGPGDSGTRRRHAAARRDRRLGHGRPNS